MSERIYQVIIGVLVLVILVGGALMVAGNRGTNGTGSLDSASKESMDNEESTAADADTTDTDETSSAESPANVATGTAAEGDSVSVADQGASKIAVASSVTLSKLGWVAVRDSKDWILGAERLTAGTHEDVAITLLRGMEAGKSYEMVLYVDDGDLAFDLHKDSLVMESDGSAVSAAFLAK